MTRVGPSTTSNAHELNPLQDKTAKFIKENIIIDGSDTDAFGEIEFAGSISRTAKYVRVSDTTDVGIIRDLLIKHWGLKAPNLIISVTGGAKNFSMRTRLMEMFQRSLIKASENTGAWITTGGTHTGVMKHVGKAVKKYAAVREDRHQKVVAIGIATWGVIYEREKLINNSEKGTNQKPKNYDPDESMQGHATILDKNHSHFILVDDGSVGVYEQEIGLRTKLESHIAQDAEKVLIVCVIVQGGPGSLKTVSDSIEENIPVVVVKGSGGWADALAEAWQASTKDKKPINRKIVEDLWKKYCTNPSNKPVTSGDIEKWTEMVEKCLLSENLFSVYDIDQADSSWDLDIAILKALLLRAKSNEGRSQAHQQLELAMKWNCSDIARDFILNDLSTYIGKAWIASLFFNALHDNKPEFCKIFLDHDVDLKVYCTVGELVKLYKSLVRKDDELKNMKLDKYEYWHLIKKKLRKHLGLSYISHYETRAERDNLANLEANVDDPYHEIFQWALLANYQEIAKHVWEYVSDAMSAAIMATKILKSFASEETNFKTKKKFKSDAYEYEMLAVGVLEKCFESDVEKTSRLLADELPKWGGCTCMQVALMADAKFFVSHPGVVAYLENVWMSKLDNETPWFHIILAGIFLIPIWITIGFKCDKGADRSRVDAGSNESGKQSHAQEIKKLTLKKKFTTFYNAPVVKFWLTIFFYVVYLTLLAFMILSDFDPTAAAAHSVLEIFLFVWSLTFVYEEIREFRNLNRAHSSASAFILYIRDPWNIMDVSSSILFFIGFFMRFSPTLLYSALIMYCLSFLIRCVRIIHMFNVHHILGPKIVMIGKMLKDLLFFLFIMNVFLIAYGVASQALLYPGEKNVADIIVGIVYKPYWQIYGELFLDEINYHPNTSAFTCSDTDANLPRCPQQSVVVPIISAIYLLFATILLLNLLIAMFSYTFNKIESKGHEIWMLHRCKLIMDFDSRPLTPFLLYSLFLIFRYCTNKCRKTDCNEQTDESTEKVDYRKWEHWRREAFLQEKREEENAKVETQITKLNNRIDGILLKIEDMQDHLKSMK